MNEDGIGHLNARTKWGPNLKLREFRQHLRADLMWRSNSFEDVDRMKYGEKPRSRNPIPGLVLEIVKTGPIRTKWPIVDVWAALRGRSFFTGDGLAISTRSIVREKKNELNLNLL
jgi:hypothetical protein